LLANKKNHSIFLDYFFSFGKTGISQVAASPLILYLHAYIFQTISKSHSFYDSAAKILKVACSGSDSTAMQFNLLGVKLATALKVSDSLQLLKSSLSLKVFLHF